jgi:hypothetical protein
VTQIFHNGQSSHGGDRNIFEVMTSTLPKGTIGSVASVLAATLYQGNHDRNVTNDHGYVPLIVNTSRSFPHSRLTTGFVTRVTRQVPIVEQGLPTLPFWRYIARTGAG